MSMRHRILIASLLAVSFPTAAVAEIPPDNPAVSESAAAERAETLLRQLRSDAGEKRIDQLAAGADRKVIQAVVQGVIEDLTLRRSVSLVSELRWVGTRYPELMIPLLDPLTKHEDDKVIRLAMITIGYIGVKYPSQTIPLLTSIARLDSETTTRVRAIDALRDVHFSEAATDADVRGVVGVFVDRLQNDPSWEARAAAARNLRMNHTAREPWLLQRTLADGSEDSRVRTAALMALLRSDAAEPAAVSSRFEALRSEARDENLDDDRRFGAIAGLVQIDEATYFSKNRFDSLPELVAVTGTKGSRDFHENVVFMIAMKYGSDAASFREKLEPLLKNEDLSPRARQALEEALNRKPQ